MKEPLLHDSHSQTLNPIKPPSNSKGVALVPEGHIDFPNGHFDAVTRHLLCAAAARKTSVTMGTGSVRKGGGGGGVGVERKLALMSSSCTCLWWLKDSREVTGKARLAKQ